MASIIDHATEIYVCVDDFLKTHPRMAHWRRSNNNEPAFTDAEVVTIGLMQSALGVATLKKTYQMIRDNLREAFPRLCSYAQWLHGLSAIVGHLIETIFRQMPLLDHLYVLDSKPIPMCKPLRHGRVRLLREDGAYFGKTSAGWFFGFKLHVLVHHRGAVISAMLTPGNHDDRGAGRALGSMTNGGVVLGDQGYSGPETFEALYEESALIRVMPSDAGPGRTLISQVRQRVETTLSSLSGQFIDRVYSRSWQGLWSTIKLKLLYFNLRCAGIISI
jgi:transposase